MSLGYVKVECVYRLHGRRQEKTKDREERINEKY